MSAIRELALAKATGGGGGGSGGTAMLAKVIDRTVEDLVIPDGVTEIGIKAFYACTKVKSVTIPDSVETIKDTAFSGVGTYNGGIKYPLIANGVKYIDSGSFSGNTNINKLVFPSIVTIGSSGFSGCTSTGYIYIGPNCTTIASGAFGGVPVATCKVECGFAEGAVSGFPANGGWAGNPADLDITYNVAEPSE